MQDDLSINYYSIQNLSHTVISVMSLSMAKMQSYNCNSKYRYLHLCFLIVCGNYNIH